MARNIKRLSAIIFFIITVVYCMNATAARAPVKLDWTSGLKTGRVASKKNLNFATPAIVDGKVYVGNAGGYLYAISLKSGKKLWEKKLDGAIQSKPLYENGALYFGSGKGIAYSINAEDGEINWHSSVGEEIMASPASDENAVYIATQNNSVAALDKSTGAIKWMATRPLPFTAMSIKAYSDPVIIDKKIYVGNTDGVLVVYDTVAGKKLTTLPLAAGRGTFTDIDTKPLKYDGKLIISTMEGALYSIDYNSGKDIWSQPVATPNNIAYDGGRIYISSEGKVLCLNVEGGEPVWESNLTAPALSQAVLTAAYVIVVSTDEKLYVLDRSTGNIMLERYIGGGTFGSPVVADDKLVVLTNSGLVYSFRIRD